MPTLEELAAAFGQQPAEPAAPGVEDLAASFTPTEAGAAPDARDLASNFNEGFGDKILDFVADQFDPLNLALLAASVGGWSLAGKAAVKLGVTGFAETAAATRLGTKLLRPNTAGRVIKRAAEGLGGAAPFALAEFIEEPKEGETRLGNFGRELLVLEALDLGLFIPLGGAVNRILGRNFTREATAASLSAAYQAAKKQLGVAEVAESALAGPKEKLAVFAGIRRKAEGLEPVAEGNVRLYRFRGSPDERGPQFFADNLTLVEPYTTRQYGGEIIYADVPKSQAIHDRLDPAAYLIETPASAKSLGRIPGRPSAVGDVELPRRPKSSLDDQAKALALASVIESHVKEAADKLGPGVAAKVLEQAERLGKMSPDELQAALASSADALRLDPAVRDAMGRLGLPQEGLDPALRLLAGDAASATATGSESAILNPIVESTISRLKSDLGGAVPRGTIAAVADPADSALPSLVDEVAGRASAPAKAAPPTTPAARILADAGLSIPKPEQPTLWLAESAETGSKVALSNPSEAIRAEALGATITPVSAPTAAEASMLATEALREAEEGAIEAVSKPLAETFARERRARERFLAAAAKMKGETLEKAATIRRSIEESAEAATNSSLDAAAAALHTEPPRAPVQMGLFDAAPRPIASPDIPTVAIGTDALGQPRLAAPPSPGLLHDAEAASLNRAYDDLERAAHQQPHPKGPCPNGDSR